MCYLILFFFVLSLFLGTVLGTDTRTLGLWPSVIVMGTCCLTAAFYQSRYAKLLPDSKCLWTAAVASCYLIFRALFPLSHWAGHADIGLILSGLALYFILSTKLNHPNHRLMIVWVLLGVMFLNLLTAGIQVLSLNQFHLLPWYLREGYGSRAGGLFVNPNHFSAFQYAIGFLGLGILCVGRGKASLKLILALVVIGAMTGPILGASRGGMVSLMAGLVVFGALLTFYVYHLQPFYFVRFISISSLILLLLLGGGLYWARQVLTQRESGLAGIQDDFRADAWRIAWEGFLNSPWFGNGAREFLLSSQLHRSSSLPFHAGEPQYVHQEYLQCLTDYGLVGLFLVLLFLFFHVKQGWRFFRNQVVENGSRLSVDGSNTLGLTIGAISAVTALIIHAGIDFIFHSGAIVLVAGVIFALLTPQIESTEKTQKPDLVDPYWENLKKTGYVLSGLILFFFFVKRGPSEIMLEKAQYDLTQGHATQAIHSLEKASIMDSRNPWTHYALAEARITPESEENLSPAELAKKAAMALEDAEKALKIEPNGSYLLWRRAGQLALANRDPEKAVHYLEVATQKAPLYQPVRLDLARAYVSAGKDDLAEEAFLEAFFQCNASIVPHWQVKEEYVRFILKWSRKHRFHDE